jgi:peptidoglycan/LPS O-acetylase OafA/YrhL
VELKILDWCEFVARRGRIAGAMRRTSACELGAASGLVTGYRPWLDGLRAVAVLMVVVQHTIGQMPIDLGFVGVGLFFALSGYLITSLLLDERAARGSVSLRRFYVRRAARLVPALVLVVLICDAIFAFQRDYAPLRASLFALTYTANYADTLPGNLMRGYGPTWSLAVEEHFYVLWPLILLWVTRRHGLRMSLRATLGVCVVAFLWRATLAVMHAPYSLLGIGSVERADAILFGCAAAIAVRLGWRPQSWMLWAGIGVVGIMPVAFAHENYAALVAGNAILAIAAAAVVVGLDYTPTTWVRACLSVRALVIVGVLSYGIYLWHGPLMRVASNFGYAGAEWRAVVALVSILIAALSHRYAESPIRSWAAERVQPVDASRRPEPVPLDRPGVASHAGDADEPHPSLRAALPVR